MPMIKQKHGGAIFNAAPGETKNPNGRPRKLVNTMKMVGYSASQVRECYEKMLALSFNELKEIIKNKNREILELNVAATLLKDYGKGSLDSIEVLLNRAHGKGIDKDANADNDQATIDSISARIEQLFSKSAIKRKKASKSKSA